MTSHCGSRSGRSQAGESLAGQALPSRADMGRRGRCEEVAHSVGIAEPSTAFGPMIVESGQVQRLEIELEIGVEQALSEKSQHTRCALCPQSSSSIRARYPDKTGSVSRERRMGRFCQNRVALATIKTFRPLTRTSTDRTRSPSASLICFSILRLTAVSVSGPGCGWRSGLGSDAIARELGRVGPAVGCPSSRPSIPGMRHVDDRCSPELFPA
jgi:hypothetical protein